MLRGFGAKAKKRLWQYYNIAVARSLQIKTITMAYANKLKFSIKRRIAALQNQYPVYRLTKNGIEVKFYDFSEYNELPFDRDTYQSNQLLIGDYANPAYIETDYLIEEFKDEYDEYKSKNQSIEGEHIIPSQKYKTYMKQDILKQIFSATGMDMDKITWLLFGVIGLEAIIIVGIIVVAL